MVINDLVTPDLEKAMADAFIKANKAAVEGQKARGTLLVGVMQCLNVECEARIADAKGNTKFAASFTIADATDADWVAARSKGNNGAKGAIADAAIKRLSGLPVITDYMRGAWRDVCATASAMLRQGIDPKDIQLSPKGNLQVPAPLMVPEPKADAPESKWDEYEALCAKPFTLDGTKGRSFTELKNKVARQSRDSDGTTAAFDMVVAFDQAIDRILDGLKIGNDECAIALSMNQLDKLAKLRLAIDEAIDLYNRP